MTVFYDKIKRKNPAKPMLAPKWYVQVKSLPTIDEKEVARQLTEETTLNAKEAEMAIAQLRKVLLRNLLDGHTVRLGDWGYFYLTVSSAGAEEEKEALPSKVKKVNLNFRYEKTFQEALNKASFISVESMQKKEKPEPASEP